MASDAAIVPPAGDAPADPASPQPAARPAHYITSVPTMAALACLGLSGNLAAVIFPILVGALLDSGLSTREVGFIESADLTGVALGALLWSRLILRINWRLGAAVAIATVVSGNLMCTLLPDFGGVLTGRAIAGLGSGTLAAIASSGLSLTRRPERTFGLISTANLVLASGIVYSFTFISHNGGSIAVFRGIAIIVAMLLLLLRLVPARPPAKPSADDTPVAPAASLPGRYGRFRPVWALILFGQLAYFVAALVFWTYAERVGVLARFSTEFMAWTLGAGQLVGAATALFTALLASVWSRRLVPMLAYLAMGICAAMLMIMASTPWTFVAAIFLLSSSWSGIYPYFVGTAVSLDPTARLVSLTVTFSFIGKALAPQISGFLVVGTRYDPAYYFSAGAFIVSTALLIAPVIAAERIVRRNLKAAITA